ncbi:MAG: DUF72 domain-containing protein [Gemmatimonadaceae bacterium]|nr:DUF72 domain-containing protein [Gemmatimonadaceae bacterium]NUQ94040.1 DUF72 domain-containing protein [Gemmatimonadaceae bacterium]NUS97508.1 DUF72 domain-containing protein [Gemmatimonadaceae bacterium]
MSEDTSDAPAPGRIRIGAQGWNYDAWLGGFYPTGTRATDFLSVYARAFDTVEVDSTFYAIPPERTIEGWVRRTPDDFVFALKLPQSITHERRLRDSEDETVLFVERARGLGRKLGPVLMQLGPDFTIHELPALTAYLAGWPPEIPLAVEFRHPSWIARDVHALLTAHGVSLALSDGPWIPRDTLLDLAAHPTADFFYIRWMGPDRSITDHSRVQVDRSREIERWTRAMRAMAAGGRAVWAYSSNYYAGHAPQTARDAQAALGQRVVPPETLGVQMSLF